MTLSQSSNTYWTTWLQRWFRPLLAAGILINAAGLLLPILEPDGALYALLARTMAQTGDFINLKLEGKDWLDKPHFPFWTTALSYRIFGVNSFAYKFPALLFWAVGAGYTYRLAHSFYGRTAAQLSVLVYMTAAHLVISNNDVRAEPYLTGLIAGSVYHYSRSLQKTFGWQLVAGSLLAAGAVMTKGPFVLITIGAGFIVHRAMRKEWRQLFHLRWVLALVLLIVFIMPELYCLYVQFDAQPQKIVFGTTGVSGLRFFFWDSQFGRFFNTGPIRGSGDPFFYFHTLLWAFLPWSLLLYAALGWSLKAMVRRRHLTEYITIGAVLISFLVFSLSRFQLPHYMNILFPFFSILLGQWLARVHMPGTLRAVQWVQYTVCVLLVLLLIAVSVFFRPPQPVLLGMVTVLLAVAAFRLFRGGRLTTVFGRSFMVALLLYGFMDFFFYPELFTYQSGSRAAAYVNSLPAGEAVGMYGDDSYSFAFYTHAPVQYWDRAALKHTPGPVLVFTRRFLLDSLAADGLTVQPLQYFPHFHISQLTGPFINYRTRAGVTDNFVIARIRPAGQIR